MSIDRGDLKTLVSSSPDQVISGSKVLQPTDYVCSGEMAPSLVTCASSYAYPSIILRSHPFYGCITFPSSHFYTQVWMFCFLRAETHGILVLG